MSLSFYDASIPPLIRALTILRSLLEKAEAHAAEQGIDPAVLTGARLAPDMHPLTNQIQLASDGAKGGGARLAGIAAPSFADTETSFAELKDRLNKTLDFLATIKPEMVDGGEGKMVEVPTPGRTLTFTGRDFLFHFCLPNLYFHVVTAYGLMRAQGVAIGKIDYLAGPYGF